MKNFLVTILTTALIAATVISSCDKNEDSGLAESNSKNVKFGSETAQSMDVYLPQGRTTSNTKVIVFIHGGSWSGGDKSDFDTDIPSIRSQLKDYAIFNINYRLANNGQNRYPAQMEDVQKAIEFITSKGDEYKIDPKKIALVGVSAGAHMALLYAYKFDPDKSIKAVVDLFGPTNLTTLYTDHPVPAASQPVLVNFLGATPTTNSAKYFEASPINFVTSQSPPTLILHGDADYIVPLSQSTTLRNALLAAGAKVEIHTYVGEGHGWFGSTLTDTYNRTISFVKANVQ